MRGNHKLFLDEAVWKRNGVKVSIILALLPLSVAPQYPDGANILHQIDANLTPGSRIATTTMIIHGRRGNRSITAKSWIEGEEKSFTEYLAPPREKGTKMLKLGDQLWLYSPQTDRTVRIAGHMLRQSLMGSDLSYEDMMEDPKLSNLYEAEVVGETSYSDRPCWVVMLTARREGVAYPTRKMWVDKERMIPLKEDRFAKSGKLLKSTEITDLAQVDGRWYPKRIIFKDMLLRGKGTEFIIESVEFDVTIPDYRFSKASLRE